MATKLIFTKEFSQLKAALASIGGKWDETQPTKKVMRVGRGIMNWFETTGTIQFQGVEKERDDLETRVRALISPTVIVAETAFAHSQDCKPVVNLKTPNAINKDAANYLAGTFDKSEVVIGIVSAVGTDTGRVITPLKARLERYGYSVQQIRVSELISLPGGSESTEFNRIRLLMRAGDKLREVSNQNAILAAGVAGRIKSLRGASHPKTAYVINSLKRPEEVELLRRIYGEAFFLIGIHADEKRRLSFLEDRGVNPEQAAELTQIDEEEAGTYGQRTRDTYHLSDFFLNLGENDDQVTNTVKRFLDLMFSDPYRNPTFDEFAMFMAFCSSIRSGDLSRQVGAIIAREKQVLATGANECPTFEGGQYWAEVDASTGEVKDRPEGKDYKHEVDSNKAEQREIIDQILENAVKEAGITGDVRVKLETVLLASRIKDLTEFGRVVHAEMDAILSCARTGIPTRGATLFCTTFPCHNCAKHIIDAGIVKVVYVEPYPKSKALELHDDSIELRTRLDDSQPATKVVFEPFTGVGARRFLDLFSMSLGTGSKLVRKNPDGSTVDWDAGTAKLRIPVLPAAYELVEAEAENLFKQFATS